MDPLCYQGRPKKTDLALTGGRQFPGAGVKGLDTGVMARPISAIRGLLPWLTVAALSAIVLAVLVRRLYGHDMLDTQDRWNWTLYTAASVAVGVVLLKRASSLRKLRASAE